MGVGGLVWFFGVAMVAWHIRQRQRVLHSVAISPSDLKFHEQQNRQSLQQAIDELRQKQEDERTRDPNELYVNGSRR